MVKTAERHKLTRKSPPKSRGAYLSSRHPPLCLPIAAAIFLPAPIFLFRDLFSGAAEPEEIDSEWAAAVSSATDSQGCMADDEEVARVLRGFENGNFSAMEDLAEGVAAADAVAAAEAEEKGAAAQSAAVKAENKTAAVAAAARSPLCVGTISTPSGSDKSGRVRWSSARSNGAR